MDENTKRIIASNLTAAFYAVHPRMVQLTETAGMQQSIILTYTGFLAQLSEAEPDPLETGT
jgi:hypothetical protein